MSPDHDRPAGGSTGDELSAVVAKRRAEAARLDQRVRLPPGRVAVRGHAARVECVSPTESPTGRAILYLHGGGFVLGLRNSHRKYALHLAEATRADVVLVDYRLAPEHPFPAALHDCLGAYRWILHGGGAPPAVVADSAGGALAIATVASVIDRSLPAPCGVALFSPWCDLDCRAESFDRLGPLDTVVDRDELRRFGLAYAPPGIRGDPLTNPLRADLRGFPPMLILHGGREVLAGDALALTERARQAGVDCGRRVWPDAGHGWQLGGGAGADEARGSAARFLLGCLDDRPTASASGLL